MMGVTRWLLGLAALLVTAPAWSQQLTVVQPPTLRCLTAGPEAGQSPVYPPALLAARQAGAVEVELRFTAADVAPAVQVKSSEGGQAFVDAVQAYAAGLRVPCMEAGDGPARLAQRFVFTPDSRPVFTSGEDPDGPERAEQLKCVARSYQPYPAYSVEALARGEDGNVLVRLTVQAADEPPSVEVFGASVLRTLKREVVNWTRQLRAPCFTGPPLQTSLLLMFRFDGETYYSFKDMGLLDFMRRIRGIGKQQVKFDTTEMGCPFDLQLVYRQPLLPNAVGQIGNVQPARQPLLSWLERAELQLADKQQSQLFGQQLQLLVPCVQIDLSPQG